jgi:hypothetical protein
MTKVIYRVVYPFNIANEVKEGHLVRVCDKLLEKVYKVEEMTAPEFIELSETEDFTRYECWVIEKSIEEEIENN